MPQGPNTAEGKAIVSQNAVRHGLRASAIVIPEVEDEAEWELFCAGVVDALSAADPLEVALAERVAGILWRLRRVTRAERAATIADTLDRRFSPWASRGDCVLANAATLQALARYESSLSRQLVHTMHELEALQDRRAGRAAPLARLDVHGLSESED